MAFIVQQFTGDNGVQLGNEEIIRPFTFGTNWSNIRLGIRMACNGVAALTSVDFRMGICTGNAASYSLSTVDALWYTLWTPSAILSLAGTPPNIYMNQNTSLGTLSQQRVGSTSSSAGSAGLNNSACSLNPTALRSGWLIDISKGTVGAATMNLTSWFKVPASVVTDASRGDFLAAMEAPTPSNFSSVSVNVTLPTRFAKDWDSMFFAWPRSTPAMCFYDMTAVRFI